MKDLDWERIGEEFWFSMRLMIMYVIFWIMNADTIPIWFLPLWGIINLMMIFLFEGFSIAVGIPKRKDDKKESRNTKE